MTPIDRIKTFHDELTAQRRDFHAHPEIGFTEHRTSDIVAREFEALGCEVHRGIGGTGVVGVLREGNGPARRRREPRWSETSRAWPCHNQRHSCLLTRSTTRPQKPPRT